MCPRQYVDILYLSIPLRRFEGLGAGRPAALLIFWRSTNLLTSALALDRISFWERYCWPYFFTSLLLFFNILYIDSYSEWNIIFLNKNSQTLQVASKAPSRVPPKASLWKCVDDLARSENESIFDYLTWLWRFGGWPARCFINFLEVKKSAHFGKSPLLYAVLGAILLTYVFNLHVAFCVFLWIDSVSEWNMLF